MSGLVEKWNKTLMSNVFIILNPFTNNGHSSSTWSKLKRVGLQIEDDLLDALLICTNDVVGLIAILRLKVDHLMSQINATVLSFHLLNKDHFFYCFTNVKIAAVFTKLSLFYLGQIKDVVY